jgi:hypothetical protein
MTTMNPPHAITLELVEKALRTAHNQTALPGVGTFYTRYCRPILLLISCP